MQIRWNHKDIRLELIEPHDPDDIDPCILKRWGAGRLDPQGECIQDLANMLLDAPWQITIGVLEKLGYTLHRKE